MSKMDGLRQMREARYAEAAARAARAPAKKAAPVAPVAERPVAPAVEDAPGAVDAPEVDGLCGHRNMSGRTCTRESGHAAKSHRYS